MKEPKCETAIASAALKAALVAEAEAERAWLADPEAHRGSWLVQSHAPSFLRYDEATKRIGRLRDELEAAGIDTAWVDEIRQLRARVAELDAALARQVERTEQAQIDGYAVAYRAGAEAMRDVIAARVKELLSGLAGLATSMRTVGNVEGAKGAEWTRDFLRSEVDNIRTLPIPEPKQ
jgi:hypothetical protein